MAEILKVEWTDENGNVYYLHTSADLVFCADGKTVEQKMKKLDGIAENANNYTHPTTPGNKHIPSGGASGQILRWSADGTAAWGADKDTVYTHPSTHPASMITQDASHRFVSDTEKSTWNGKASTAEATQSQKGLMSAADKKKLDGVETGANKYVHPTSSGNKHIPSGGKSGQILRWSADGTAAWGEDKDTVYIHPSTHPASMITPDANHRFVSDTEKSTWNGKIGADTGITFSEASDRGNLASGEKLGTLFGKVKKWFSDLKPFAFLDLIQNATTAAADRAVSAAVAKALQDQINTLNTNKADVEDVTRKFNWGTSINYKAVRIGKMVIFCATCTAKTTEPMNFAIINDPALVPVTWTQLNAYTDSGDDFDKRAIAFVTENKVMARTYAGYNTTQPEALTGNVIVNGSWIIN